MASAGRTYGGKSPEDRRAERRERLLTAALEVVGEDGAAALTVRGVTTRAALTPRYFYEEFGTADALLRELFDREFDAGMAAVAAAVAAAGAADETTATGAVGADATLAGAATANAVRLQAAVGAVLDFLTAVPHRPALLLTQASGAGVLAARRQERMDDVVALVAAFARSTYGTGEPPPPERAADADRAVRSAATFVAGGLAQTVDAWIHGRIDGDRDVLRDDLAAQILAVGDTASARLEARARHGAGPASQI